MRARPAHPEWARKLRDDCHAAGVRFTFKQWGRWAPVTPIRAGEAAVEWAEGEMPFGEDCTDCRGLEALITEDTVLMRDVGKKAAGHELDGEVYGWLPKVEEVLR